LAHPGAALGLDRPAHRAVVDRGGVDEAGGRPQRHDQQDEHDRGDGDEAYAAGLGHCVHSVVLSAATRSSRSSRRSTSMPESTVVASTTSPAIAKPDGAITSGSRYRSVAMPCTSSADRPYPSAKPGSSASRLRVSSSPNSIARASPRV